MEMYGMTGERLGTIGQHPDTHSQQLPEWKRDFLSKPSASARRGIAWGFDPPFEDTDTLVLTAPSGKFVDVRFPKDTKSSEETLNHSSFWAFTGVAETTFYDADAQRHAVDMSHVAHCKFVHEVDSRGPGISDEGDMFLLLNGDCLEMGVMQNPKTGREELYKEYWRSAGKLVDENGQDDSKKCVVAQPDSSVGITGIAVRLGGRVQSVVQRSSKGHTNSLEVERWVRSSTSGAEKSEESQQGAWIRDQRSNGSIPHSWLCHIGRNVGDELEHDGICWQIVEIGV